MQPNISSEACPSSLLRVLPGTGSIVKKDGKYKYLACPWTKFVSKAGFFPIQQVCGWSASVDLCAHITHFGVGNSNSEQFLV